MQIASGALIGLVFIAAGLAFKLAAVPFHMWTPDVYEGAPTPVTAFLAAAPKVAAIGLTLRVFYQPFGDWAAEWQQIVVFISIASMLLGAFAAIGQTNIKRLLAYSSIGHVGYALVGLAAGTPEGAYSVMVYMAIYLVMTVGTFGCVLVMRRHGLAVEGIDDLAGLASHQPLLAAALAVFMFSLAGIPPLAGFFAKLYVFIAAVDAGLVPLAVHRRAGERGRRLLLHQDRQGDVLRRGARGLRPADRPRVRDRHRGHRGAQRGLLPASEPAPDPGPGRRRGPALVTSGCRLPRRLRPADARAARQHQ